MTKCCSVRCPQRSHVRIIRWWNSGLYSGDMSPHSKTTRRLPRRTPLQQNSNSENSSASRSLVRRSAVHSVENPRHPWFNFCRGSRVGCEGVPPSRTSHKKFGRHETQRPTRGTRRPFDYRSEQTVCSPIPSFVLCLPAVATHCVAGGRVIRG